MKKSVLTPLIALVISALLLFGMAYGLNGMANENARAEHMRILQTLLPGSAEFVVEPYDGEDANIRSVHKGETGYIIETVTYGYAGEITMLIAVKNDGTVCGLVVRGMSETFGLGWRALTDWEFLAQFLKIGTSATIGTPGEVDAFSGATGETVETDDTVYVDGITGATVTSKAIARCVNSAVAYVTGADAVTEATSWGG